ncbi:MAG: hypothetical protein KTR14_04660 [Vampirovibrio sp.]|nr:hypothetical protein [Vampirovibrio sp.]
MQIIAPSKITVSNPLTLHTFKPLVRFSQQTEPPASNKKPEFADLLEEKWAVFKQILDAKDAFLAGGKILWAYPQWHQTFIQAEKAIHIKPTNKPDGIEDSPSTASLQNSLDLIHFDHFMDTFSLAAARTLEILHNIRIRKAAPHPAPILSGGSQPVPPASHTLYTTLLTEYPGLLTIIHSPGNLSISQKVLETHPTLTGEEKARHLTQLQTAQPQLLGLPPENLIQIADRLINGQEWSDILN